jgi:hypothetical protein
MDFPKKAVMSEWYVSHPACIRPEDLLHFVYLEEFEQDWSELHANDIDEMSLWALEILIMGNPTGPSVIPGTGGLRKIRFSREGSDRGKSGGERICYAYFPDHHVVVMVIAFGKNDKENLSQAEKQGIKKYLDYIRRLLDEKA